MTISCDSCSTSDDGTKCHYNSTHVWLLTMVCNNFELQSIQLYRLYVKVYGAQYPCERSQKTRNYPFSLRYHKTMSNTTYCKDHLQQTKIVCASFVATVAKDKELRIFIFSYFHSTRENNTVERPPLMFCCRRHLLASKVNIHSNITRLQLWLLCLSKFALQRQHPSCTMWQRPGRQNRLSLLHSASSWLTARSFRWAQIGFVASSTTSSKILFAPMRRCTWNVHSKPLQYAAVCYDAKLVIYLPSLFKTLIYSPTTVSMLHTLVDTKRVSHWRRG